MESKSHTTSTFVFVKHHPCEPVARLYMQIATQVAADALYSAGWYKLLDYGLDGTTWPSGLITLAAEAYNPQAAQLLTQVLQQPLHPTSERIARALGQLRAASKYTLQLDDKAGVMDGLRELDAQPWQLLDDITQQRPVDSPLEIWPLYETNEPAPQPTTITLRTTPGNIPAKLLPLWHQLARVTSIAMGQALCSQSGAYFDDDEIITTNNQPILHSVLLLDPTAATAAPEQLVRICTKARQQVYTASVLERFSAWLSGDYTHNPIAAPDSHRVYEDLGVLVGAAGWQALSRPEHIALIVKSQHTTLSYRSTTSVNVAPLPGALSTPSR